MAQTKTTIPTSVVERNLRLTGDIMRYLLEHPQVFKSLPDQFQLVVLPEDDPEIRLYNLDLLDRYGSEGRPIVLARVTVQQSTPPSLFVPLPLAA